MLFNMLYDILYPPGIPAYPFGFKIISYVVYCLLHAIQLFLTRTLQAAKSWLYCVLYYTLNIF